jgi:adenosylcobyric acid synthase
MIAGTAQLCEARRRARTGRTQMSDFPFRVDDGAGTSGAGKSTVVGMCRLLKQRGVKVAPFKPQTWRCWRGDHDAVADRPGTGTNITAGAPHQARSSFAQTVATPAQVVIMARCAPDERARLPQYKPVAGGAVLESYGRRKAYESVIVEGAGSPAEINLRSATS